MGETAEFPMILQCFEAERDAEYARFLAALGPPRISAWNPRATADWDRDRRRKAEDHMRRWSRAWWADRGYVVSSDPETGALIVRAAGEGGGDG